MADTFGLENKMIGEENPGNKIWIQVTNLKGDKLCQLWTPSCTQGKKCKSCRVTYLTGLERAKRKLTFDEENKLWLDYSGQPYDTEQENIKHQVKVKTYFDKTAQDLWGIVPGIWVVDPQGNFYTSVEQSPGKFHHSSFLAGGLVEGAGQVVFVKGVITHINNASGHYKPDRSSFHKLLAALKVNGNAKVDYSLDSHMSESPTKLRTSRTKIPSDDRSGSGSESDSDSKSEDQGNPTEEFYSGPQVYNLQDSYQIEFPGKDQQH